MKDKIYGLPPISGNVWFISDCHFGLPDWKARRDMIRAWEKNHPL